MARVWPVLHECGYIHTIYGYVLLCCTVTVLCVSLGLLLLMDLCVSGWGGGGDKKQCC